MGLQIANIGNIRSNNIYIYTHHISLYLHEPRVAQTTHIHIPLHSPKAPNNIRPRDPIKTFGAPDCVIYHSRAHAKSMISKNVYIAWIYSYLFSHSTRYPLVVWMCVYHKVLRASPWCVWCGNAKFDKSFPMVGAKIRKSIHDARAITPGAKPLIQKQFLDEFLYAQRSWLYCYSRWGRECVRCAMVPNIYIYIYIRAAPHIIRVY